MTHKKRYRDKVAEYQGLAFGCIPSQLVKISGQHKEKQSLAQYIMMEEANDDKGDNAMSNSKSLVLNRLQPSTS